MWAWLASGYLCGQAGDVGEVLSLNSMYYVLLASLRNDVQLFIPKKVFAKYKGTDSFVWEVFCGILRLPIKIYRNQSADPCMN